MSDTGPTERLRAAAAKLDERADRKDSGRSANPHEAQRGFLARRAIEDRAVANLLRQFTMHPGEPDAFLQRAALAVAAAVLDTEGESDG